MREILPQAYDLYSEDKILSITQSVGEKIVLQRAREDLLLSGGSKGEKPAPKPSK
jgi:hypothetical protein